MSSMSSSCLREGEPMGAESIDFDLDMPDLDGFIKELDMFNENVNTALRKGLHEAGDMICKSQKRLVLSKSRHLSEAISTGNVYTTKSGALGITSGYQADAFKTDSDGFNAGLVGMVTEFGRPGKSSRRQGETMTQTRKGRKYTIKKGTIQAYPHIRRGFDSTKEAAAQKLIDAYNAEINKLGD